MDLESAPLQQAEVTLFPVEETTSCTPGGRWVLLPSAFAAAGCRGGSYRHAEPCQESVA